jgi:septum site-determining protein MinC
MGIKDCINVTLKKNEVIIKIDVTADHKKVMANLKKKIPELKKLYKEDKTPILIKGKILSTKEKNEIKTLIQDAIDVEVRFEGAKALGLYGIQETYCREISTSETKFHRGSLRSGQRLEFEGSIVILGDVNSGAEVIAGDNIVVVKGGAEVIAGGNVVILGTLRGLAHAGANGNKSAIIAANSIETLQIRIANIVKEIERDEVDILKTYAYIEKDDKITME